MSRGLFLLLFLTWLCIISIRLPSLYLIIIFSSLNYYLSFSCKEMLIYFTNKSIYTFIWTYILTAMIYICILHFQDGCLVLRSSSGDVLQESDVCIHSRCWQLPRLFLRGCTAAQIREGMKRRPPLGAKSGQLSVAPWRSEDCFSRPTLP